MLWLSQTMAVIDLNFDPTIGSAVWLWRHTHERREAIVRATHRLPSHARVSQVRPPLRWQSTRAQLLLLGSVSLHDLRPVVLPRELARYCRVPARHGAQALPHGHPWQG